ncbi:MAG: hypothetical protein ACRDHN_02715, partial [Thermomicrobiales bacterium]
MKVPPVVKLQTPPGLTTVNHRFPSGPVAICPGLALSGPDVIPHGMEPEAKGYSVTVPAESIRLTLGAFGRDVRGLTIRRWD